MDTRRIRKLSERNRQLISPFFLNTLQLSSIYVPGTAYSLSLNVMTAISVVNNLIPLLLFTCFTSFFAIKSFSKRICYFRTFYNVYYYV